MEDEAATCTTVLRTPRVLLQRVWSINKTVASGKGGSDAGSDANRFDSPILFTHLLQGWFLDEEMQLGLAGTRFQSVRVSAPSSFSFVVGSSKLNSSTSSRALATGGGMMMRAFLGAGSSVVIVFAASSCFLGLSLSSSFEEDSTSSTSSPASPSEFESSLSSSEL